MTEAAKQDEMTEAANEFVAKMIDRSVFTPNELALCNRIQELEAALAQKTGECEQAQQQVRDCLKDLATANTKQVRAEAQVEQLERQVAKLTKKSRNVEL